MRQAAGLAFGLLGFIGWIVLGIAAPYPVNVFGWVMLVVTTLAFCVAARK